MQETPSNRSSNGRSGNSKTREKWGSKIEFLLACVGYCVGVGNIWRFPYLCYINGGGAFLIPYFLMLALCGIPLLYMEMAVGQLTRLGPVHAIARLSPLLKGSGLAMVLVSFVISTYYNVIVAWAINYFFHSFSNPLPWMSCKNWWNDAYCVSEFKNTTLNHNISNNVTSTFDVESASLQYFNKYVLVVSSGIDDFGDMNWEMVGCLFLASFITFCCICKSVKSLGKAVYVTAILPYVILITLLVKSVTLDGARDGILYYITPSWDRLSDPKVWLLAATQIFNSIGISYGSLIAFSSYNSKSNNIYKDTMTIGLVNSGTSFLAGFVVFSSLGGIAKTLGVTVEEAVKAGPELVFVAIPSLFNHFPLPNLWAVIFFLMLITLGIGSQFGNLEVVCTTLSDFLQKRFRNVPRLKEIIAGSVCVVGFLAGLPNVTQGGIYYFTLIDNFAAVLSLMLVAYFEVMAVCWFYGGNRLARETSFLSGYRPYYFFPFCWIFVTPMLITVISYFSLFQFKPFGYGGYELPAWAVAYGSLVVISVLMWIPVGAIHELYRNEGTFKQRFMKAATPTFIPEHVKRTSCKYESKLMPSEQEKASESTAKQQLLYTVDEDD